MDAFYKAVPRKLLPKEYGGEAGTIEELTKAFEKRLVASRAFFLDEEKYGVDESKRVGKATIVNSMFGVEGSFRSLAID